MASPKLSFNFGVAIIPHPRCRSSPPTCPNIQCLRRDIVILMCTPNIYQRIELYIQPSFGPPFHRTHLIFLRSVLHLRKRCSSVPLPALLTTKTCIPQTPACHVRFHKPQQCCIALKSYLSSLALHLQTILLFKLQFIYVLVLSHMST